MLSEILKLLPRQEIQKLTQVYKGDYYCKSFETWDHLVAMLTGQLAGVTSLRDLETTLNYHPTFAEMNLAKNGATVEKEGKVKKNMQ
jgi:hypothetical protein